MDLELKPQLPLLALKYATLECSLELRQKKKKPQPTSSSCLLCAGHLTEYQLCVLSPCYHDCVGQEPVTGGHSSVDEFWERLCHSNRATDLLRAGWNPVFVRHHPDSSLLQNQDLQC